MDQREETYATFALGCGKDAFGIRLCPTTISKIMTGGDDHNTVGFSVADRIVSHGLGNPFLWWSTNLRDYYQEIPLNDHERNLLARAS